MKNQPENTMSLISQDGKRLTRQFDGKTDNFDNKRERNYYRSMLKAYLKGFSQFCTGRNDENKKIYSPVEQSYLYV